VAHLHKVLPAKSSFGCHKTGRFVFRRSPVPEILYVNFFQHIFVPGSVQLLLFVFF